jgi:hypothetical protein
MIDEQTNTPDNDSGIDNDSGSDVGSTNEASYYLRDLTEDDVYSRLQQAGNFPGHLTGLESRFNGNFSQVQERLAGLEKSLGAQTSFDFSKLQKVLADYDPKLAEILVPALTDAIKVAPLDDTVFRPHLDSVANKLTEAFGQQLVLSIYSPETLEQIIPPVKNGKFVPEGQRHKDFVDWYSQQGYQTQQALLNFGAPYVNALRKFEEWEQNKKQEKTKSAGNKSSRLAQGQVPTSQSRHTNTAGVQSAEDSFLAAFEEVYKEGR